MAELPRKSFFLAVTLNQRLIRLPLFSAQQPPWRTLDSVRVAADVKVVQRFHFDFDADTAAESAGAAAVGAQSVALVKQRVIQFLKFDRCIFHVALAHGHRGRCAVLEWTATPTSADDVLTDIAPAALWMRSKDRVAAHVSLMRRGNAVRQGRRQRAKNRVENRRQGQPPTADGRATWRAEQFSRPKDDLARAQ